MDSGSGPRNAGESCSPPKPLRRVAAKSLIKPTHRPLWYEDGVLKRVLEPGCYVRPLYFNLGFYRRPRVEVVLVDVRERELTIKGQVILTADKVAIRVSIIVQFRVADPAAAIHAVLNFEERLYCDCKSLRRSANSRVRPMPGSTLVSTNISTVRKTSGSKKPVL